MKQYQLQNAPIVYYLSETAHKETVLFLHAAFVDHRMFDAQAAYFQDRYNVLTLDLLGHGNSTAARKGDRIDNTSAWIREILKKEQIEKVHLVGVSLGAVLAQDFADKFPDAVRSLACFGGYDIHHFDAASQRENRASQMRMMGKAIFSIKWFAAANQKLSAYTEQAQQEFYRMNLAFPRKSFRYLSSLDKMINVRQAAPRGYPLLIGCGAHDIASEKTAIALWKAREPDCSVVIFPGAGHCVNLDVPQQFHQTLEQFWTTGSCK